MFGHARIIAAGSIGAIALAFVAYYMFSGHGQSQTPTPVWVPPEPKTQVSSLGPAAIANRVGEAVAARLVPGEVPTGSIQQLQQVVRTVVLSLASDDPAPYESFMRGQSVRLSSRAGHLLDLYYETGALSGIDPEAWSAMTPGERFRLAWERAEARAATWIAVGIDELDVWTEGRIPPLPEGATARGLRSVFDTPPPNSGDDFRPQVWLDLPVRFNENSPVLLRIGFVYYEESPGPGWFPFNIQTIGNGPRPRLLF